MNQPTIDDGFRQRENTSPDRNLAAGVLIQALFDAHATSEEVRREAHRFLFSEEQPYVTVRAYWLRSAGIKVSNLDSVKALSLEQLRRRMDDQPRWRSQRRARFNERTRQAAA